MKKTIYLLWFLSATLFFKGQTFPQLSDNPSWKVGVWSFWTSGCEAFNWKYGNSISICNNSYIEVLECDYTNSNCAVMGYIRVAGQTVYARKTNSCTETDRVMYNFAVPAGSGYTMAYNLGSYDSTGAQVTATQTIAYQNINRLTQFITYTVDPPANNYTDNMQAIAGIGCDIHPFFPLTCFGDFCETNLQLIEYKENNVVLYSKTPVFPLPCNSWVGISENSLSHRFSILPNPATDHMTIKTPSGYTGLCVLDALGRALIRQGKGDGETVISLSGLPNGIYVIALTLPENNVTITQKFVKE